LTEDKHIEVSPKSGKVFYLLFIWLGLLGAHRFYAEKIKSGFFNLICFFIVFTFPAWVMISKVYKDNNFYYWKIIHGLFSLFFLLLLLRDFMMISNNEFIDGKGKLISTKGFVKVSSGNFSGFYLILFSLWVMFLGPLFWFISLYFYLEK
jgi:TM2 domain-containing membrane protein YozV